MRPFQYKAPTTLAEAIALLSAVGERAKPLAGGTDLLVQLRYKRFDVDTVVDIKAIPELNQLSFDAADGLTVGAAVSCARLCERPDIRAAYPGLVDAASIIGGVAIQGRATLGGNLCNAAPSGDSIPAMIVLGAQAQIAGPGGERAVPVVDFCIAPGKTVLRRGELLVALHFPAPAPRSGAAYMRFIPRGEMDIAVAGAGAWIKLSEDLSTIVDARLALSAVAPRPLAAGEAAASLVGKAPTETVFEEAAALAREAVLPITDVRGTESQRRHMAGVLVKRALLGAITRAKGERLNG